MSFILLKKLMIFLDKYLFWWTNTFEEMIDKVDDMYITVVDLQVPRRYILPSHTFEDWEVESSVEGQLDEKYYSAYILHLVRRNDQ